jgi:Ca2+-binding RTX toxin-like protein
MNLKTSRRRCGQTFRRAVDSLESRALLAAVEPTIYEQYMIELINRARANPAAEAARYNGYTDMYGNTFNGQLGEGGASISSTPKQPLALNLNLTYSARTHAQYLMSSNTFGHTGSGGSSPSQRMAAAGYTFAGSYASAENVGIDGNSSLPNDNTLVEDQHAALFTDMTVAGRGHRLNMMMSNTREIGSGITKGSFNYANFGYNGSLASIITAQNFATTQGNAFITGVAFNDTVVNNDFYNPGEGLAGITVRAVGANGTFTTTTLTAGGYSLQVPAGTYTVTATGGAFGSKVVTYTNVTIGSENVKRDFMSDQAVNAPAPDPGPSLPSYLTLNGSTLTINGTAGDDTIAASLSGTTLTVTRNGETTNIPNAAGVSTISISSLAGNDQITVTSFAGTSAVDAGDGNDVVFTGDGNDQVTLGTGDDYCFAGAGNDTVFGGAGKDTITVGAGKNIAYGEDGDDRLNGSGGRDSLYGAGGNDRIYGGGGGDLLDGGAQTDRIWGGDGDDMLIGGGGVDRLWGEAGNDTLIGNAGADLLNGGLGVNTGYRDADDTDLSFLQTLFG